MCCYGWCLRDARTTQIQFEISRAAWQHKFWDIVHSTAQIIEPSQGLCAVMGGAGVTDVLKTVYRKL